MSEKIDFTEYDEDECVKFIREQLSEEFKKAVTDDEINYIVDLIYEYYEDKGFIDSELTDDSTVEFDEVELLDFVIKNAIKDNVKKFTPEQVEAIVLAELAYCDKLNLFE